MPSDTGQGLCRYAGLRCPSEVGVITWADVNWEKGRLTVLSKKTEHHGGDHAVRVVPMQGALHEILGEAFEQAPEGNTLVAPKAAGGGLNLRTTFTKIVTRAGCKPWPRLFQDLRASCETNCVGKHPAHKCAARLRHSPVIAAGSRKESQGIAKRNTNRSLIESYHGFTEQDRRHVQKESGAAGTRTQDQRIKSPK